SIPELKTDDSGTYLSVKQQLLTAEDLSLSKDQLDQEVSLINDYFILSTFKKTFAVKTEQSKDYYEEIKKNIFFDADAYSYWGWNEKMNVLIYFQEKTDSTVYYSQSGIVIVYLNDDNELLYYTQTILGQEEFLAESNELITPLEAIETLYRANTLRPGDDV